MTEKKSIASKLSPSDIYGAAALVIMVLIAAVFVLSYFLFVRKPIVQTTTLAVDQGDSLVSGSSDDDDDYEYEYDDEDYEDWDDEPIYVLNMIDLPDPAQTKALFERNCMSCHGSGGEGDGVAAEFLIPRPRNFVASPYRFAAEWSDEAHIVADLERTIRTGVPRSAMPAFGGVLSESQVAGLAKYVFDLRDTDTVTTSSEQVEVGARPPLTVELVNRGKELFTNLACTTCHGETGAGDGILALNLVDFQQNPVRPADFTTGLFKSGQRSEDLVRSILKGVPGTPMVAYEGILLVENEDSDEESYNTIDAWALASYIRTLAPKTPPSGVPSGFDIAAKPAMDVSMMSDPTHPAWLGVQAASLRVNPLQTRHDELTHVDVRTVRSDDQIAICIEWNDSSLNPLEVSGDRQPDGMAVMFGLDESPSAVQVTAVESENDDPMLNEWHWSADKQYVCAGGDPSADSIDFGVLTGWPFYVLAPGEVPQSSIDTSKEMDSQECAVIESNGLVPQALENQGSTASAVWIDGVWRVLITRDLKTDDSMDIQFIEGIRVPISISIWDGSAGSRLEAMSVSSWHWLTVEP